MVARAVTQSSERAALSLADHLALVPDPRHDQGKRHSLAALLNLVAAALLCGMRSLQAIAQFGRALSKQDAATLGFTHPRTPCKSTLSEVLRQVDAHQLELRLRAWAQGQTGGDDHLALDGKTLRGTADEAVPAVHLLALYAVAAGVTLAQAPVGDKTNEHKAALDLLRHVPLDGKVVTADAMFTHRDFCTVVLEGGGDYVLPAKDNQPTLLRDIQALFAPQPGLSPPPANGGRRRSAASQ
jgi:DDE_Tnp_1-associated/Transposase DDE domain